MNTHLNGNIYLQKNSQEINNSLKTTPLNLFNNVSFEESSYFPVEDNTHQIDLKNVNKSIGLSDEKIKSIKDELSDFFQKSTIADGISDEEFKFIENFQNYFEYSSIETDGIKSDNLIKFNLKNFPILLTSGDEIKINLEYFNGIIEAKYEECSIDTSSTIDKIVIYFGNGIKYLTKIEAGGDYLYLDEDSGQIYAILASTENSIKSNFIKVEDEQLIKSGSIAGNTEFKHVLGSESIYKKEADYYKLFQFNHKHYYVRIIYFNNFCAFYYNTNLNYHVSNSYITKFPFFLKGNMAKLEKDYLISIIKSIFIKDNQVKLQNIMNNDKSFIPMYCAHYIFLMVYMKDIIKDNDFLIKKIIINDNERYEEILKETNNLLESLKNNLLESLNNFSIPIVSRDKLGIIDVSDSTKKTKSLPRRTSDTDQLKCDIKRTFQNFNNNITNIPQKQEFYGELKKFIDYPPVFTSKWLEDWNIISENNCKDLFIDNTIKSDDCNQFLLMLNGLSKYKLLSTDDELGKLLFNISQLKLYKSNQKTINKVSIANKILIFFGNIFNWFRSKFRDLFNVKTDSSKELSKYLENQIKQ